MPEIGTSGSMSGDGKRSAAAWPKLPRPSSTLPSRQISSREFTVGIDAKRTFVDKRSRPNLQRMTHLRHNPASEPTEIRRCSLVAPNPRCAILWFGLEFTSKGVGA